MRVSCEGSPAPADASRRSALVEGVMMAIITPTAMPLAKCRGIPHQLWLRSRTATRLTGWHCKIARLFGARLHVDRIVALDRFRIRHSPVMPARDVSRIAEAAHFVLI